MSDVLVRLKDNKTEMNPAEKNVADYILNDPSRASSMSIHELASRSFVSTSAVIRMCRDIGYEGYRDFRRALTMEIAVDQNDQLSNDVDDLVQGDSPSDVARKITVQNISALKDTLALVDPDMMATCAKKMHEADRILFFGLGASFLAGKDLYTKLLRQNKTSILNEDWHVQLLTARNSLPTDLAICISSSGRTDEVVTCMQAMKKNHTPMLAITRSVKTPVYLLADYHLFTTSSEPGSQASGMSSRISQLNVIDILYSCYAGADYDESVRMVRKTHVFKNS